MMTALYMLFSTMAFGKDVQLCGQWTPDWQEASEVDDDLYDANGDGIVDNDVQDRLTTNDPVAAHGLLAVAYKRTLTPGGGGAGPWTAYWAGYLSVAGPTAGCTDVVDVATSLATVTQVQLKIYSSLGVASHYMPVFDDDVNEEVGDALSTIASITPTLPTRLDVDLGSGDARIDTAIAVAWALNREDAGVIGLDYDIYACPNPRSAPNCLSPGASGGVLKFDERQMYVGGTSLLRRILHELGHAVTAHAMPSTVDPFDGNYDWSNIDLVTPTQGGGSVLVLDAESSCEYPHEDNPTLYAASTNKHYMASDEATASAIIEGYASYYAAQTLNRVDEGDCFLVGSYDWDHDDDTDRYDWFSCEQRPEPQLAIQNRDYWEDQCFRTAPGSGELTVASEYDWIKGLWDLDTDEGMTFSQTVEIFAAANPHTWSDETTLATAVCNTECAHARMLIGAYTLDPTYLWYWTRLNNQCDNGICR